MWYVYILKSELFGRYYIGYTGNLDNRLRWHNSGKSRWTKRFIPWEMVYAESYERKTEAIKREKQMKAFKSRIYIENMIMKMNPGNMKHI